jgi:hypothetical protein
VSLILVFHNAHGLDSEIYSYKNNAISHLLFAYNILCGVIFHVLWSLRGSHAGFDR